MQHATLFSAHINPLLLLIRACSLNPAQTSPILLECSIVSPITPFYHSVMFRLTIQPMIMEKGHGIGSVIQFSGALPLSSKSLHRRRLNWSSSAAFHSLNWRFRMQRRRAFFFFLLFFSGHKQMFSVIHLKTKICKNMTHTSTKCSRSTNCCTDTDLLYFSILVFTTLCGYITVSRNSGLSTQGAASKRLWG